MIIPGLDTLAENLCNNGYAVRHLLCERLNTAQYVNKFDDSGRPQVDSVSGNGIHKLRAVKYVAISVDKGVLVFSCNEISLAKTLCYRIRGGSVYAEQIDRALRHDTDLCDDFRLPHVFMRYV